MTIRGKKILVTGGAGFIGAHAAKRLHELGAHVVVVDNFNPYYSPKLKRDRVRALLGKTGIPVIRADISNLKQMERIFKMHSFDIICHQAAQAGVRYSVTNPFAYETANVSGTLVLLELCARFSIRSFVFASSSSVYGDRQKVPFRETDMTDAPVSLYAATKKSCELIAYAYHSLYGMHVTGLRYFTVYGPWGRPDMSPMLFTDAIRDGKEIRLFNKGNMLRDFTYVDDVVEGIVRAIRKDEPFLVANIGAGKPVRLDYFIRLLESEMGKPARIRLTEHQKGDVKKTYADTSLAKKKFGWTAHIPFERGIGNFVSWYREYNRIP